jgi:hypothetical protein
MMPGRVDPTFCLQAREVGRWSDASTDRMSLAHSLLGRIDGSGSEMSPGAQSIR